MFATIIMNSNKELKKTTTPVIYQQENNADKILVLLPQTYGDLNLKDCAVTLNWIQPVQDNANQNPGNIKLLDFETDLYNDTYLQAIFPLTSTETSVSGKMEIFLTIVESSLGVDMKTGSVFLDVKPHKKITDYVNPVELELLSDYLIKMQQLNNTCTQVLTLATEQADRAEQSANLIIQLMQEWEDTHKP